MSIPSYITIPQAASPIDGPGRKSSSRPVPPPPRARLPSFPPSSSTVPPPPRKFSVPSTSSLSTNVSDMLLSSLLPPNLPKIPQAKTAGGPGRPRELSSQRESLSLPLMSNNFRRFITKVGPVFWLQDRFEEALFWRKPKWTWTYLLFWTCISFKPKLLLLLPSATLLLILLHIHERTNPLPSLLGVALGPTPMGTARVTANVAQGGSASSPVVSSSGAFTSSTGVDGEVIPVVPPKEAESGVDFFMNMQAIQNLMGLISDMYDSAAPFIQHLTSPTSSPTAFPITLTHVILLLLPPTLLLPLIPNSFLPFLLLPIGYIPPLLFHPNLTPFVLGLSRNPAFLKLRSLAEKAILTDELSDEIGRCQIGRVEVFENERLDPSIVSKQSSSSTTTPVALPPGSWSSKHLRAGERAPWVKILEQGNSLWSKSVDGNPTDTDKKDGERMVLALEDNWEFIPNDQWRVDVCGLWSDLGTDEDGWSYSDDSWQNPGPAPFSDAETPSSDKQALPGLALRRITRRRRWWRRVYLPSSSET